MWPLWSCSDISVFFFRIPKCLKAIAEECFLSSGNSSFRDLISLIDTMPKSFTPKRLSLLIHTRTRFAPHLKFACATRLRGSACSEQSWGKASFAFIPLKIQHDILAGRCWLVRLRQGDDLSKPLLLEDALFCSFESCTWVLPRMKSVRGWWEWEVSQILGRVILYGMVTGH